MISVIKVRVLKRVTNIRGTVANVKRMVAKGSLIGELVVE